MSALFNFNSFLVTVLLTICTCTYVKLIYPAALNVKTGCGNTEEVGLCSLQGPRPLRRSSYVPGALTCSSS